MPWRRLRVALFSITNIKLPLFFNHFRKFSLKESPIPWSGLSFSAAAFTEEHTVWWHKELDRKLRSISPVSCLFLHCRTPSFKPFLAATFHGHSGCWLSLFPYGSPLNSTYILFLIIENKSNGKERRIIRKCKSWLYSWWGLRKDFSSLSLSFCL